MKIVFILDNSELIRRLKVHKQYDEPYPNETLKSEFDVTEHQQHMVYTLLTSGCKDIKT
jgi:hypothetical protein